MSDAGDVESSVDALVTKILEQFREESVKEGYNLDAIRLVDTHTHLLEPHFPNDLIGPESARLSLVTVIINVASSLDECETLLGLSDKFPVLKPCFGIHPSTVSAYALAQSASGASDASLALALTEPLGRLIAQHKLRLVGIGECGLDFSPHLATSDQVKSVQRLVLEQHVKWSREHGLALNVHSRSAGKPALDLLQKLNASKVLLHAFDGRPAFAQQAAKLGWKLSVPASIVRAEAFQKLVAAVPLESLCLETDSPALHPVKEIARIKGISLREVAQTTTATATALFGL